WVVGRPVMLPLTKPPGTVAMNGGMQESTQPGLPTQPGSVQSTEGSRQLGRGMQPETMMGQKGLHVSVPPSKPRDWQVVPPERGPSQSSPGSLWPLPQRLAPLLEVLDELLDDAPPVAMPPVPLPPVPVPPVPVPPVPLPPVAPLVDADDEDEVLACPPVP